MTSHRLIITMSEELMAWLEARKEETGASYAEIIRRELEKARKREQEEREK